MNAKEVPINATVKIDQAREIASATFSGKILKEELEKETGGSGLHCSFDIKSASVNHEIGVDTLDGKVLENSVENFTSD